jgi:hypothetical protein
MIPAAAERIQQLMRADDFKYDETVSRFVDPTSGYYFDPLTTLYYDATSGYYFQFSFADSKYYPHSYVVNYQLAAAAASSAPGDAQQQQQQAGYNPWSTASVTGTTAAAASSSTAGTQYLSQAPVTADLAIAAATAATTAGKVDGFTPEQQAEYESYFKQEQPEQPAYQKERVLTLFLLVQESPGVESGSVLCVGHEGAYIGR